MITRTTASTFTTLPNIFPRRSLSWTTLWRGTGSPPPPSNDKKEPTKHKDPMTLRLDVLESKYKKDSASVQTSIKSLHEKHEKQEVRKNAVEKFKTDLSSLMSRMVSVEKAVSDKKSISSQATMNSEMISQALNRIKALEEREKADAEKEKEKDMHPITKLLLGHKGQWKEMGFENVGRLEKFAADLPKALSFIAPEPEIAIHATAGRIVDIFEHLPAEDKQVMQSVFPIIFGRPVDDWKNASAEEKAKSIADVAYQFVWKLANTTAVEETVLVRRILRGKP
ncbi:hypothetical protein BDD12DRAFT_839039 [Trichophaea hybrida]|nr:hypothetical protein BDD12DRAFT_839039 [Trichophaea hybrida]